MPAVAKRVLPETRLWQTLQPVELRLARPQEQASCEPARPQLRWLSPGCSSPQPESVPVVGLSTMLALPVMRIANPATA